MTKNDSASRARKFVMDWLFNDPRRQTVSREWDRQYISDASNMISTLETENARLKSELEEIRPILISFTEAMETVWAYCGNEVAHDSALARWEFSLKTCNDILNRLPK